jgi:hypothetical protein
MIVRNDITADTYCPLPFSTAAYCRLKKDFRVHASDVQLDRGYTDDGKPYVSVTVPGITEDAVIIIRSERGWQMHRGGDGPLFEFASETEVADFFGSEVWCPFAAGTVRSPMPLQCPSRPLQWLDNTISRPLQ